MKYVFAAYFTLLALFTQGVQAVERQEIVITSQQMHEFSINTGKWRSVVDFYYNPKDIPTDLFATDSRLVGLSSELREEEQHRIIEEMIRGHVKQLNDVPKSTFFGRYRGRTSHGASCNTPRSPIICWSHALPDSTLGRATLGTFNSVGEPYPIPFQADIKLNATSLAKHSHAIVSHVILHEMLHVAGLGHEEALTAIMHPKAKEATQLFQDDIDGLLSLHSHIDTCAPKIEVMNGVPSFIAQVFFEDELYRGRFVYQDTGGLAHSSRQKFLLGVQ